MVFITFEKGIRIKISGFVATTVKLTAFWKVVSIDKSDETGNGSKIKGG